MIEDLRRRNFAEATIRSYLHETSTSASTSIEVPIRLGPNTSGIVEAILMSVELRYHAVSKPSVSTFDDRVYPEMGDNHGGKYP